MLEIASSGKKFAEKERNKLSGEKGKGKESGGESRGLVHGPHPFQLKVRKKNIGKKLRKSLT